MDLVSSRELHNCGHANHLFFWLVVTSVFGRSCCVTHHLHWILVSDLEVATAIISPMVFRSRLLIRGWGTSTFSRLAIHCIVQAFLHLFHIKGSIAVNPLFWRIFNFCLSIQKNETWQKINICTLRKPIPICTLWIQLVAVCWLGHAFWKTNASKIEVINKHFYNKICS